MIAVYSTNADTAKAKEAAAALGGRATYREIDGFLADEAAPLVQGRPGDALEGVYVYGTGKGSKERREAVQARYGKAAEVKDLSAAAGAAAKAAKG